MNGWQDRQTMKASVRRWMKRRATIEPTIGHLKSDQRMGRNYLKGNAGDEANVILTAATYNLARLLAWFCCAQKVRGLFRRLFEITCENLIFAPNFA